MRTPKADLFTTNYGVDYDKWIATTPQNLVGGFFESFTKDGYIINVSTAVYYLLVQVVDNTGKVVFMDYVKSIADYKKLKKKLRWT